MVGSRGKGSRSKPKGVAPSASLMISFDEPADGSLGVVEGEIDSSNIIPIPLEKEQMDEDKSASVIGDGHQEKEQTANEGSDVKKDVTEINEMNGDRTENVCTQEGTEENDGGGASDDANAENNGENPEDDEVPVNFGLDGGDACTADERKNLEVTTDGLPTNNEGLDAPNHGPMENFADNLENSGEPSNLNADEPIGTLSDRVVEEPAEENASITNEVKDAAAQVTRPKRKLVKKKVVRKKMVRKQGAVVHEKVTLPSYENNAAVEACNIDATEDATNEEKTSNVNSASDEACEGDKNKHASNEEKEEVKPPVKVNKRVGNIKKDKAPQGHSGVETAKVEQKLPTENDAACKVDMIKDANNEEKKSNMNRTLGEACKTVTNEHVSNEGKAEVEPPVKVTKKGRKIKKKKAPQRHLGVATIKADQKPPTENNEPSIKEPAKINKPDVKNEVVENSGNKVNLVSKKKKKKAAKKASMQGAPQAVNEPNPSKEGKAPKRVDSMGMVFMCSSETKKDCYRYNVLGLPAGKKDLVSKIYKGMRLFLFDVDLRMMYGIYKAADPGGFNLEPRAFKSQYPSQVRFITLEDCVPLAEERFKKVLKDNYYSKNKFSCQLNSAQVRNLCKLFHETNKKAESTKGSGKNPKSAATSSSSQRDKKRKRVEDSRGGAATTSERERSRRRAQEEIRYAPVVIDNRYHGRPIYKRETYVPSVAPVPIYQPVTAVSPARSRAYFYDRASGVDSYKRDPVLDYDPYRREIPVSDRDSHRREIPVSERDSYRREIPVSERDSYRREIPVSERDSYRREIPVIANDPYRRNPVFDHDLYRRDSILDHQDLAPSSSREPRIPTRSHHEPYASYREVREPSFYSGPASYSIGTKREQHYDYTSTGRSAEYYRATAAEDRPAPPLYRRY